MNNKTRYTRLAERLVALGWRVERRGRGGGHYLCFPPDPRLGPVTIPLTPSAGPKSHLPYRTLLRQRGFREEF